MALFNPHIDTEEEVLAIRKKAKSLLAKGVTVISWSSENSSGNLQFTRPIDEVMEETEAFLQLLNPAKYGRRIRTAQSRFNRPYYGGGW
jgi:hypothetical protein